MTRLDTLQIAPWPFFDGDEQHAVERVLRSGKVNYWTGEECRKFENEFSSYIGSEYSITLANGTAALELALLALDIGKDDEVIVTSRSFVASASSILRVGAIPVFADVCRDSQNISPETIEPLISKNTKAIIAVHLAGWPCDMPSITSLAKNYSLKVIEDCAQAHGAKISNKKIGSFGDCGVFSFCQDKIISTGGEGGMLVTDNKDVWERAWSYKDHGKNFNKIEQKDNQKTHFRWLHDSLGTNWRMTEMQAAIGRIQLTKLDDWVTKRKANAEVLSKSLEKFDWIRIPKAPENYTHAFYKFYCFLDPAKDPPISRDFLLTKLIEAGIPAFSGSCSEIYLEEMFSHTHCAPSHRLPVAQELGETSIMFPVHPTITMEQISEMAKQICSIASQCSR